MSCRACQRRAPGTAFGDAASLSRRARRTSSRVHSSRSTSARRSAPQERWFCGAERRSSFTRKHKKAKRCPFVGAVEFAGKDNRRRAPGPHAEHYPYPARRKKEPEATCQFTIRVEGHSRRECAALREGMGGETGTRHSRSSHAVRTDMEFDRDHNLERYLDLQKFALYVPRCVEIKILRCGHAIDATPARAGDWLISSPCARTRRRFSRGVNDQFFVAQGDTFGRVARLYEYIPSLYADATCTFHPEHLDMRPAGPLRLELRPLRGRCRPRRCPSAVPGFASASGREGGALRDPRGGGPHPAVPGQRGGGVAAPLVLPTTPIQVPASVGRARGRPGRRAYPSAVS